MSKKKIRRVVLRPHPDPEKAKRGEKVKALTADFKTVKEEWNIYELEEGTIIRSKLLITRVDKTLDLKTGDILYTDDGTPQYGVEFRVETVFEFPENMIKGGTS